MANFDTAFAETMKAEGGYVNDPQDPGGETYRGVARKANPKWEGWTVIDMMKSRSNFPRNLDGSTELQNLIREFYLVNYWHRIKGDDIVNQDIAESIFDFAVNAGVGPAAKLAQTTVNTDPDGVIGTETLKKINADDPRAFLAVFALHKIARYVSICDKRTDSRKYFFGWVKRTLEAL